MAAAAGLVLLGLGGPASADEKMIGSLAAVDASAKTFTVQETGASDSTAFSVDDDTQIREGRKEVELSTLQPGRSVKVSYVSAEGVALARRVDLGVQLGPDKSSPVPNRVDSAP